MPNPIKCPECGYPTGFKESQGQTLGLIIPYPKGMEDERRFEERHAITQESFQYGIYRDTETLTEEELKKREDEAADMARESFRREVANRKERFRSDVREKSIGIQSRYQHWGMIPPMENRTEPLVSLKRRLANIYYPSKLEGDLEEEEDHLRFLKAFDSDSLNRKWETETDKNRWNRDAEHKSFLDELEEDKRIIAHAIPFTEEIVAAYKERREELKKAELEATPLVAKANEIVKRFPKLVEEINRLVEPLLRSDVELYQKKMVDEKIRKLRPLLSKFNKIRKEYETVEGQVLQLHVHTNPWLPGVPSTRLNALPPHLMLKIAEESA